jgi:hypothetical protein
MRKNLRIKRRKAVSRLQSEPMMTVAVRQAFCSIIKNKKWSKRKWGVYTWRGRYYDSLKHHELLFQRHSVTPQKIWTNGLGKKLFEVKKRWVQCNQQTQQHHLHLEGVTIHTAHQLTTQYSATSRHKNTTSTWMVSLYTQHSNSQLSTVHPADITTPPPLGWCHYTHSTSTHNSAYIILSIFYF